MSRFPVPPLGARGPFWVPLGGESPLSGTQNDPRMLDAGLNALRLSGAGRHDDTVAYFKRDAVRAEVERHDERLLIAHAHTRRQPKIAGAGMSVGFGKPNEVIGDELCQGARFFDVPGPAAIAVLAIDHASILSRRIERGN